MFARRHYEYLINKITNDTHFEIHEKRLFARQMSQWFSFDFENFKPDRWAKRWKENMKHALFPSDSNSQGT